MGQQLDLFTGRVSSHAAPAPEPPPREEPLVLLQEALPGQVGLFDFQPLALGRARDAVAEGRLDEARGRPSADHAPTFPERLFNNKFKQLRERPDSSAPRAQEVVSRPGTPCASPG